MLVGSAEGIHLEKRQSWKTDTQPEGMVADDEYDLLYVGEEEKGIWRIPIKGIAGISLLEESSKENNPYIEYWEKLKGKVL